jgi:hypothetical protein
MIRMTKEQLYKMAEELGITEFLMAAEEFERKDCEKICTAFAMNERRVEVAAALTRAADMIRLRSATGGNSVSLPSINIPKDFLTYVD